MSSHYINWLWSLASAAQSNAQQATNELSKLKANEFTAISYLGSNNSYNISLVFLLLPVLIAHEATGHLWCGHALSMNYN